MSQRMDEPGLVPPPARDAPLTATLGEDEIDPGAPAPPRKPTSTRKARRRARQTRVVIRKVGPWSVFKFSLLFYLCIMLVILLALGILYAALSAIGAIDSVTKLIGDLFADKSFEIHGDWIFARLVVVGLAMVVVWSLINVFVAFLYNLISDVVGGIEVTLAERR